MTTTCKGCGCALPEGYVDCAGDVLTPFDRHARTEEEKAKPKTTFEILDACRAEPLLAESSMTWPKGTFMVFDYEKLYKAVDVLVDHRNAVAEVVEKLGESVKLARHMFDKEGGE